MKNDGRLGRNWLLGKIGDKLNAILAACGYNLRLMLRRLGIKKRTDRLFFVLLRWLWGWFCGLMRREFDPTTSHTAALEIGI